MSLDEAMRLRKKNAPKKKKPAAKRGTGGGRGRGAGGRGGGRKAKAGGAAGKVAKARAAKKSTKTPPGKWKHDLFPGKGKGGIQKKKGRGGGRGGRGGRGRGRGGGGGRGGGRGGGGGGGGVKETTITKKADGTWDIKLAKKDEGKCIYVGNIPVGMNWKLVKETFENAGSVDFCEITGTSKVRCPPPHPFHRSLTVLSVCSKRQRRW